ncbi:MAG: hypothetical protein KC493_06225 [Bacteriovoracaceae bacterium]|nr:hypothetical protein [Bacteriovoracaceae bacterium]
MKKKIENFLSTLPEKRRSEFSEILSVFRKNISSEFEEVLDGDMIRFELPLKLYPNTYNKKPLMFASLSNRKANMTMTLTAVYNDPKIKNSFIENCSNKKNKLETKRACIKFKSIDEIPLKLIGTSLKKIKQDKFVKNYESLMKK